MRLSFHASLLLLPLLFSGLVLLGLLLYAPYLLAALGIALVLLMLVLGAAFWWFRRRWRRILAQADQAFERAAEKASASASAADGPVVYVQAQEVRHPGQNDS